MTDGEISNSDVRKLLEVATRPPHAYPIQFDFKNELVLLTPGERDWLVQWAKAGLEKTSQEYLAFMMQLVSEQADRDAQ